jgi:UDP:flavonoid glycosyltransferase YjiC (YdhE family)
VTTGGSSQRDALNARAAPPGDRQDPEEAWRKTPNVPDEQVGYLVGGVVAGADVRSNAWGRSDLGRFDDAVMRTLFLLSGGIGHFHPLVEIAEGLLERGHTVAFATRPSFCDTLERAGFVALPLGFDEPDAKRSDRRQQKGVGLDRASRTIYELLAEAIEAVPELAHVARSWRADVLVREGTRCCSSACVMAWSSWLAGGTLELPVALVDLGSWPTELLRALAGDEFARARDRLGLDPDPHLRSLEGSVRVLGGPPGWFPEKWMTPNTYLVQPPEFDARESIESSDHPTSGPGSADRPAVYATLGTAFNATPGLFEMIFDALGEEDLDVIATVGADLDPDRYAPLPSNIRVERYVPQSLVLPWCHAVVSHGGYSSIMGALRAGLPVVALPLAAADNETNAARVVALGAGIAIREEDRSACRIRAAVRAVLAEPHYRRAARSVAASICSLPPITQAADLIERTIVEQRHRQQR